MSSKKKERTKLYPFGSPGKRSYAAFKEASSKEGGKMFYEAKEEHRAVEKLVLPDLKKTDASSLEFAGRAKVLKELVEHHAEEEEKEMFAMAKKNMSKEELQSLGERRQERKSQLEKSKQERKPPKAIGPSLTKGTAAGQSRSFGCVASQGYPPYPICEKVPRLRFRARSSPW